MEQDAMQGIMGVGGAPAPMAQGPMVPPGVVPEVTGDQMAAFERARQDIAPGDFANELMTAGQEIDPAAVEELRQTMLQANLPLEVLLAIISMVEAVLADPGQYAQNRAELIAEGVPPDLLPEQFDAEFFGALQLAVEQHIATMPAPSDMGGMEPQGFAQGGLASLKPIAQTLQSYGRNGDTMLAHITPQEARMLQRMGGSGTINPVTGLREYFLGGVGKAIGGAFKSAGKAVTGAVKSVASATKKFVQSPVGRIATGIALFYFAGPLAAQMGMSAAGAAAFKGFVGGFGSSLLAGDGLGRSLRNGALTGVIAGVGAGVMGGAEAFQAGSYTGPATYGEQFQQLRSGVSNIFGGQPAGAEALPVDMSGPVQGTPLAPSAPQVTAPQAPVAPQVPAPGGLNIPVPQAALATDPTMSVQGMQNLAQTGAGGGVGGAPQQSVLSRAMNFLSPPTPSPEALNQIGLQAVQRASAYAQSIGEPALTEAVRTQIFNKAVADATPSFLRQYGPLAAAGLGIMGLTGGFQDQGSEVPSLYDPSVTGFSLLQQDPERYGVQLGPTQTVYASPQARPPEEEYASFYTAMQQNPFLGRMPTRTLAKGGPANPDHFPRRNGAINGPGTATSDSIPAMLSDGEFVFTARAVRGAGGGSRRDGAKRMYQMMKQFERNA